MLSSPLCMVVKVLTSLIGQFHAGKVGNQKLDRNINRIVHILSCHSLRHTKNLMGSNGSLVNIYTEYEYN